MGLLLGSAALGCGEAAGDGATGPADTPAGLDLDPALVEGLRIGPDQTFPNAEQAESASVVQASTGIAYTCFNGDDLAHVSYPTSTTRKICKGTSLGTYLIRATNGVFGPLRRLPVPTGYSALWGDPAVGYLNGSVFISQLAAPDDIFNTVSGNQTCWTNNHGDSAEGMLAGACIFQSTSQTTTPNFALSGCVRSGNDFYDGGSISGDGNSMMAAYWNTDQNRIDVWRGPSGGWVRKATPFPGKVMGGHPLMLNGVVVVAPDASGTLWASNYHPASNTWSTPVSVGGPFASDVTLANGTVIRSVGYAAAMGGPLGVNVPANVYVIYGKWTGSFVQQRMSICQISTTTGDLASCTDQPALATATTANAFLPSIAIAHPGASPAPFTDVEVRVSFWSDQGMSGGNVQLRSFNTATPSVVSVTRPQIPCPDTRGYWGDYDDMYVVNDFTLNPAFVRPYTDSSDSACQATEFNAIPQHVSEWTLPVTGFTPLALNTGWSNAPFSTRPAAISLNGGIVRLQGAIATGGTNTSPFTLPAAYRPNTDVYVPVDLANAHNGRLHITPGGTVTVDASSWANAQTFTSLENVFYPVNATGFTGLSLVSGWTASPFSTRAPAVTLDYGVVRFEGAIANGTDFKAFTLPPAFRPGTDTWIPVDLCGASKGRILVQATGDTFVYAETSFGNAQCFTSLEGASFALNPASPSALTLINGWSNAPFGTRNAMAVTDRHTVQLFGAISTAGTNAAAFLLPPEMRPSTMVYVPVDMYNATNGRLEISPTGSVSVAAETTASNAFQFTSLEGASFSLF